ncbi:uncharacterized protein BDZ99DRAFT_58143 [Mytilinidion resinicola]|uniref:Uncharacterized protein n=1 Tax=Mytilinidion resinicola TaxID=574789 RepID=A0A6A6YJ31_9PEZI|nr:uncharacterized protein BDZ99DRAFT_58143 [Mytilinidion resinicola]KAF2808558.1 hypothetical protein BDZ99DRAFT_58143 [Mytilinidion resinicola]
MVCCCACRVHAQDSTPPAPSVASLSQGDVPTVPDGGQSFNPPDTYITELSLQQSDRPSSSGQTWRRPPQHLYMEPRPIDHAISNTVLPHPRDYPVPRPPFDHTSHAAQQGIIRGRNEKPFSSNAYLQVPHDRFQHSPETIPRPNVHPDVDQPIKCIERGLRKLETNEEVCRRVLRQHRKTSWDPLQRFLLEPSLECDFLYHAEYLDYIDHIGNSR